MTHGFEGSQVGATPIEEGMPQKTARKKLLMMQNGTPPDVGPPSAAVRMGPITQTLEWTPFGTQGGPTY